MDQLRTTEEILRELIRRKGIDYLCKEQLFVNAVDDLGGAKADVRLLRYLVEVGGVVSILKADGQPAAMRKTIYSQTVDKLCSQALVSREHAHRVCGIFWRAVYNEEPPAAMQKPSAPEPEVRKQQPQEDTGAKPDPRKPQPQEDTGPKPDPRKPRPQEDSGSGSETDAGKPRRFQRKHGLLVLAILAVGAAVFGILNLAADRPRLDLKPYHLEESVEQMLLAGTEDTYTYPDGSHMEFYHDDAGRENYRVYVNKDDAIGYLFAARYDSQGRLIQHQSFDGAGSLLRSDDYDFHNSEDTAQRRVTLGSGESFQGTSTFDEEGNETFTLPRLDGSEMVYRYTKDGLLFHQQGYDPAGEPMEELAGDDYFSIDWDRAYKVMSNGNTEVGYAFPGSNTYTFAQGICGGPLIEYSVSADAAFIDIYDPMGNLLEELQYRDGQLDELGTHRVYNYDSQGNYAGYMRTLYMDDGDRHIDVYDANEIRISSEIHNFVDGKEEVYYHRYETELDEQGREVCVRTFDGKTGRLERIEEYEYDSQGNKQKKTSTVYSEDGGYSVYVTDGERKALSNVSYYPNGNIEYQREYSKPGIESKWASYYENGQIQYLYEYNAAGEKVKNTRYYPSGQIEYVSEYNDAGDTISEIGYYENGNISVWDEYNKDGIPTKTTWYYEEGQVESVIEYNNGGKMVKDTFYYQSGQVADISEYNDAGDRISSIGYYENGNVWHISEYNDQGEQIKDIYYNEDGTIDEDGIYIK